MYTNKSRGNLNAEVKHISVVEHSLYQEFVLNK